MSGSSKTWLLCEAKGAKDESQNGSTFLYEERSPAASEVNKQVSWQWPGSSTTWWSLIKEVHYDGARLSQSWELKYVSQDQ